MEHPHRICYSINRWKLAKRHLVADARDVPLTITIISSNRLQPAPTGMIRWHSSARLMRYLQYRGLSGQPRKIPDKLPDSAQKRRMLVKSDLNYMTKTQY
ncbi:hypothetical protein GCM10027093_59830 [Paraburkholderia jirisanensis]